MLKLFTRYASVGVFNTVIHWLVFAGLYTSGARQSLANSLAFGVAVTFSFFANAQWTFRAEATSRRYMLYVVFMGMMAAGTGWTADQLHTSPVITLTAFSLVSLLSGFICSHCIIFRGEK